MHRAALAVANAGLFAHELRRHSARISALRPEVTVPAMSAGNPVAVVKMCADAGGHRFLANIKMHIARKFAGFPQATKPLLPPADNPIGRTSCRGSVCTEVEMPVVDVPLKK